METSYLQSFLAAPLAIYSVYYAVWALLNPRRASLLGLSAAVYGVQFCWGPILGLFGICPVMSANSSTVVLAFAEIYAFWITAFAVVYFIKSPLESVWVVEKNGMDRSSGVFTNMAKVASTIRIFPFVCAYAAILLIRIYLHLAYGTVLSGTGSLEAGLAIPYGPRVMYDVASPLGFSLPFAIIIMVANKKNTSAIPILICILAVEFLFGFTQGRRWMMMMIIFGIFGAITIGNGLKLKHAIAVVVLAMLMLKVVSPLFHFTRLEWEEHPDRSVTEWLSNGYKRMTEGDTSDYQRSVTDRLNAITFSYQIAEKQVGGYPTMNGGVLQNSAIMVIPRVFLPDKLTRVAEPDTLVNEAYDLRKVDQPSNMPSFGLADFGLPGGVLYGGLFALGFRAIEFLLRWLFRNSRLLAIGAVGSIAVECVFSMEATPTTFADAIRGVAVIAMLGFVVSCVVRGGRKLSKGPLYWSLTKRFSPARMRMPPGRGLAVGQSRGAAQMLPADPKPIGIQVLDPLGRFENLDVSTID